MLVPGESRFPPDEFMDRGESTIESWTPANIYIYISLGKQSCLMYDVSHENRPRETFVPDRPLKKLPLALNWRCHGEEVWVSGVTRKSSDLGSSTCGALVMGLSGFGFLCFLWALPHRKNLEFRRLVSGSKTHGSVSQKKTETLSVQDLWKAKSCFEASKQDLTFHSLQAKTLLPLRPWQCQNATYRFVSFRHMLNLWSTPTRITRTPDKWSQED